MSFDCKPRAANRFRCMALQIWGHDAFPLGHDTMFDRPWRLQVHARLSLRFVDRVMERERGWVDWTDRQGWGRVVKKIGDQQTWSVLHVLKAAWGSKTQVPQVFTVWRWGGRTNMNGPPTTSIC